MLRYSGDIASAAGSISNIGIKCDSGSELVSSLCETTDQLSLNLKKLEAALHGHPSGINPLEDARYMHDEILPVMDALRKSADRLETLTDRSYWPFPTYDELLFSI